MSAAGLIFALLFVAAGCAYVLLPITRQAQIRSQSERARKAHDELLTAYERVLSAVRDLDEDFQTGKLDAETHHEERSRWVQRGAGLLQQIEQSSPTVTTPPSAAPKPEVSDDDPVEALIARYSKSTTAS